MMIASAKDLDQELDTRQDDPAQARLPDPNTRPRLDSGLPPDASLPPPPQTPRQTEADATKIGSVPIFDADNTKIGTDPIFPRSADASEGGQATPTDASPAEPADRPAGFFADERQSYQGQMILGQGRSPGHAADLAEMGATGATPKRSQAELGGVLRPGEHPQVPTSRDGVAPAEMTEDMAALIRASVPPPPDRPINSVEDLLEVVHVLPVVEIFRRMKHLKASRIRRMLDSRKFREHMDLRRRLAWEKASTEAAVVVPAAVDRLYCLTMCDKPETARKSCMALIRMGRQGQASEMGGTLKRSQAELGGVLRPSQHPQEYLGVAPEAGSAPFRLVPTGAGDCAVGSHNDRQERGLQQPAPPDAQKPKTTPKGERTAKTGSGAAGLRKSFMDALEARLRKA